jgi:hypothetical protein
VLVSVLEQLGCVDMTPGQLANALSIHEKDMIAIDTLLAAKADPNKRSRYGNCHLRWQQRHKGLRLLNRLFAQARELTMCLENSGRRRSSLQLVPAALRAWHCFLKLARTEAFPTAREKLLLNAL